MTEPKKKHHHPDGSPTVRKIGGSVKFTVCGQSWYVGASRVLQLIRNRKDKEQQKFHFLNPSEREVKRGLDFFTKWLKMRRYIAVRYGNKEEPALIEEIKRYNAYLRKSKEYKASKLKKDWKEALINQSEAYTADLGKSKAYLGL